MESQFFAYELFICSDATAIRVIHIETLNSLTTIKPAVTLITDSNYEYFLDETPKPVLQGCADLSHETLQVPCCSQSVDYQTAYLRLELRQQHI